jgi:hypothetical protein
MFSKDLKLCVRHIFTHLQSLFHLSMQWGCNGGPNIFFKGVPPTPWALVPRQNTLARTLKTQIFQKIFRKIQAVYISWKALHFYLQ